uniref:Putative secreted protein n=1 Tax=Anopheles triannulatus TaxID=58253 RepID=A0A2M4B757_9DIPT
MGVFFVCPFGASLAFLASGGYGGCGCIQGPFGSGWSFGSGLSGGGGPFCLLEWGLRLLEVPILVELLGCSDPFRLLCEHCFKCGVGHGYNQTRVYQ